MSVEQGNMGWSADYAGDLINNMTTGQFSK